MTRSIQDRYGLPPDHEVFVRSEPASGRIIVIAPTRAACETIELALALHIETFLELQHGARVRELARGGKGFGIVAGTGTGKTLAIRPIAEEILCTAELRVGVVNREREATPDTPTWNVIIVTTGIARRWFEDGDILPTDTLVVDEIHQTSAELELCLALGKRVGCRFVWLSATVDPTFYRQYLSSADVLEVVDFDERKAAAVRVIDKEPLDFLDDRFLQQVVRQRRGIAMFVPTRRGVEAAAQHVEMNAPRVNTAYYHGGEPIRIIRPFLEGGEKKPYFLAMTAAGQSALNVRGLDTVVIDDVRFYNEVDRGRNVLTQEHLGANEILQMAGRVHGRVEGGRVFILSDRDIQFSQLRPTAPEFQLGGDSERVAITCAALGVRADDLELPVPLDRQAYRQALGMLERRGIVERGRLTEYGRKVEAMPVERSWAELLVLGDDALLPFLAVMSAIESLHRMTREERDLDGVVVPGSDHLTAYNLYAEAYQSAGYLGEVYGLPRHLFDEHSIDDWATRRGVLVKAVEDAALGMASVYRAIGLPLPASMPNAGDEELRAFQQLLAEYMPFDLVIDEETVNGEEARVSKTSVCGSWGAIGGEIRYFADKLGIPRASIEGTQVPMDLVRRYAHASEPELIFDAARKRAPLALRRRVDYFGFDLGRELEAIDEFPSELRDESRRLVAEALARGEARHAAVKRNQPLIDAVRETWRRSGGKTPKLGVAELAALYEARLRDVNSMTDFRHTDLDLSLELEAFVPASTRAAYERLPANVFVRDRDVEIQYDVEEGSEGNVGVARLRLPEKLARTLTEAELPPLDRPLRFVVTRGARGAARAATLDALQEELDRPFTEEELEAMNRAWEARREERRERKRRQRDAKRGGSGGDADARHGGGHRRRRQRPGRRERAGQRESPDAAVKPNESERRRGPRTPYVESEHGEQPRRRGGLRGRRGPRWR
ncbi:MAG TPA: DEAD/DEAH box helicase [Gemmatimonadaceae bacterium]|nr:DEAD/DEAH box helicase [Gemmatimonadaceae bacterium]